MNNMVSVDIKGWLWRVAIALGAVVAIPSSAFTINSDYIPIEASTGAVVPGEWNASISAGKSYADENHVPMLAIYGTAFCGNCHQFQTACNSDEFLEWAARKKIVMVFNTDTETKNFCQAPGNTALPFVCIYWPKDDGTLVLEKFTGRLGTMPSSEGDSLAAQIINSCDMYIGQYPTLVGFEYLAFTENYHGARLEAEVGRTYYVDVPLYRDSFMKGYVSTNSFRAVCNGVVIMDETIVWEASALEMSVRVDIPSEIAAGDEIVVTLKASNGDEKGTVTIFAVDEKENSTKNPLFIGERTAQTLGYGEWTMDIDVAMEKYRNEPDAHMMAVASGSLWCPDCVMTDGHVLETEAFKAWAIDNKVILVDIDVPNFPNTTNSACLLTRVVARTSDGYISGRGTLVTNEFERFQSGAGYLSRHMISDADAKAVLERNRSLVGKNVLEGGWNNPDRKNQDRTGIPNFFALDRTGTVVGTFETFDAIGPSEFKDAYLKRFSELVALEDDVGSDFPNRSWQTTEDMFDGTGEVEGTLSAIDLLDTFALVPVSQSAVQQEILVNGADPLVNATVNLIAVSDGAAMTVATAKGRLASGVSVKWILTPHETYYVQIVGSAEGTLAPDSAAASTRTAYTVSGSRKTVDNPFSNEWIGKKMSSTLPMFLNGGNELAGRLVLNLKRNGKLAAKLYLVEGVVVSFRGEWDKDISADGTAWTQMQKGNYALSVRISADGVVKAQVDGGKSLTSGACALSDAGYGEFVGNYAAALQLVSCSVDSPITSGNAYLTLSMAKSRAAVDKGAIKFVVYLPNGEKLSGKTGVTLYDANFGIVPIFKRSGVNVFSAAVLVRSNAGSAATRRAVISADDVNTFWRGDGFECVYGVYGSFISPGDSLLALSGTESLAFTLRTGQLYAANMYYGAFKGALYDGGVLKVSPEGIAPAEKVRGFSFKLNRKTGVFKGKTILSFTAKDRVSAKFSGVVLPDWFSDCECQEDDDVVVPMVFMPFGAGYCLFSDRVGVARVKRSFPLELGAADNK